MMSDMAVRDSADNRAARIGNRWRAKVVRTAAGAARLRVTAAYALLLIGVSLTLTMLGPHARDAAVSRMSTNLHNLRHGHMGTLVGSAFVDDGGAVYVWLPGLVCLLALGELIWRGRGLVVTFAVGHLGATLIVAAGLAAALEAGWLPVSVARASDVGVSYGAVCVLGALTASIPSRWRAVWIGWWLGVAVVAALGGDFTAFGHILALLLGVRLSFQLPSTAHWTPIRVALLSVSVAFGYFVLSGSLMAAPMAGLAGVLIALLAGRIMRPDRVIARESG
jgi:Rhomboid-like protein